MKLICLGSSSSGNCYILEGKKESLILECGVNLKEIKREVQLSKVVGCLLTHEHKDHSKSAKGLMRLGVKIYSSLGTLMALELGILVRKAVKMQSRIFYKIGSFSVIPYKVEHDAEHPYMYIIRHAECGNVLFITDAVYVPYKFLWLNNIIIEANYSEQIVEKNIESGRLPQFVRDRLLNSHMSLETCKGFLAAIDLSKVQNIVLVHLSDGNSNDKSFKRQVGKLTGKKVFIADKGLKIEFNKEPF